MLAYALYCQRIDTYLEDGRKLLLVEHHILQVDVDFALLLWSEIIVNLALVGNCRPNALHRTLKPAGPSVTLQNAILEHLTVLTEGLQLNFLLLILVSQMCTYPVDLLRPRSLLTEFLLVEAASTSLISGRIVHVEIILAGSLLKRV